MSEASPIIACLARLSSAPQLLSGSLIDLDGSLLLELGLFFALFLLLNRWIFKPMIALFDAREAAIDGAKRDAKTIEAEAEKTLREFEGEMKKVKVEATRERDALRQDAVRLERELVAKAREEADAILGEATSQMNGEAAKIRAEMKTIAPELAKQIAEKLLGRKAA
jgi:F-type H+-transporting ATPase subunit b